MTVYFYYIHTEEEDMKATRNQGHTVLLQKNKENKEFLLKKKKD